MLPVNNRESVCTSLALEPASGYGDGCLLTLHKAAEMALQPPLPNPVSLPIRAVRGGLVMDRALDCLKAQETVGE